MNSLLKKLPNSAGSKRLLFFHHAGGSGSQYFPSLRPQAPQTEIYVLDLPGRFLRTEEAPFTSLTELVQALKKEIATLPPMPTYFLGHSFGALIAYALAWEIHTTIQLKGLGLSALRGSSPESQRLHQNFSAMSDQDLLKEIEKFSELPEVVKKQPALLAQTLRALRADFTVMASFHNPHRNHKLETPTLVFGGTEDKQVTPENLESWRPLVELKKNPLLFAGDHFYIFNNMSQILKELFSLKD